MCIVKIKLTGCPLGQTIFVSVVQEEYSVEISGQ